MNCVVDKSDNMKVIDFDSHFSEFIGVHQSKIKQGKLFFHDILQPKDRETIFKKLCKKGFRFNYFEIEILNAENEPVLVHCMADNIEDSTLCRITIVDISKSEEKQEKLKQKTKEMNSLIDMVTGGVCLFKVTSELHIEAIYLNKGCCKLFGTTRSNYGDRAYRIDELIHPEDKTVVFQAIGKSMATDEDIDLEIRVSTHKGEYSWVKFSAAIKNYDLDGNPIFHAMLTDITRIKQAEEKADEESEKLVRIFKNLPDNLFCTTTENLLSPDYVSEDFIDLLGYSRAEFFEKCNGDLKNIIEIDDIEKLHQDIKNQCIENESVSVTYNVKLKNNAVLKIKDERKVVLRENGGFSTIGKYTIFE